MIEWLVKRVMRAKGVPMCHLCDTPTTNTLRTQLTCSGCEDEAGMVIE